MMTFFTPLFLLISTISDIKPLLPHPVKNSIESIITKTFSGTDQLLYCHFELNDALEFQKEFDITKLNDGWSGRIQAKVIQGSSLLYQDKPVKIYEVELQCHNDDAKKKISYDIIHKITVSSINDDGIREETFITETQSGQIQNPSIDLTKEPTFELLKDHFGRFVFENAFPFSELK
jgi:hypothetical protein